MALIYQLRGILIKELIQIKRNICLFSIELLCPIFLIFIFFYFRKIFPIETISFESSYNNNQEFIIKNGTNLTNKNDTYMLEQCQNNSLIALIGHNFPREIETKINSILSELQNTKIIKLYKDFKNKKEFLEYLNSPKYGKENPKICFGITYNDDYEFEIHYSSENIFYLFSNYYRL